MAQFINLLDRNIDLVHIDGTIETLEASINPAKPVTIDADTEVDGISVMTRKITTEQVLNLPPPIEGIIYLIPAPLGWMVRNRSDVFIPTFEMNLETKKLVTKKIVQHIFE